MCKSTINSYVFFGDLDDQTETTLKGSYLDRLWTLFLYLHYKYLGNVTNSIYEHYINYFYLNEFKYVTRTFYLACVVCTFKKIWKGNHTNSVVAQLVARWLWKCNNHRPPANSVKWPSAVQCLVCYFGLFNCIPYIYIHILFKWIKRILIWMLVIFVVRMCCKNLMVPYLTVNFKAHNNLLHWDGCNDFWFPLTYYSR